MTDRIFAQEYLGEFVNDLLQFFPDDLIKKCMVLKRRKGIIPGRRYYLGVDVAGLGEDECSYEVMEILNNKMIEQRANFTAKRNLTVDTSREIFNMNRQYNFKKIGVDDAGVGFGVWSELMNDERTKFKTIALNNASRSVDKAGVKHKIFLRTDQKDDKEVDMVVPKGYYFMMGDNRDDSYDSRYWGAVPKELIKGKAMSIYWSWADNKQEPYFTGLSSLPRIVGTYLWRLPGRIRYSRLGGVIH